METLFKSIYSSVEVVNEICLLKRFEWQDIFAKLREKNCVIYVNTAYKQKVNKIKSINLEKITGKVPDRLSN